MFVSFFRDDEHVSIIFCLHLAGDPDTRASLTHLLSLLLVNVPLSYMDASRVVAVSESPLHQTLLDPHQHQ